MSEPPDDRTRALVDQLITAVTDLGVRLEAMRQILIDRGLVTEADFETRRQQVATDLEARLRQSLESADLLALLHQVVRSPGGTMH